MDTFILLFAVVITMAFCALLWWLSDKIGSALEGKWPTFLIVILIIGMWILAVSLFGPIARALIAPHQIYVEDSSTIYVL